MPMVHTSALCPMALSYPVLWPMTYGMLTGRRHGNENLCLLKNQARQQLTQGVATNK